ncbi:MAG: tRNA uridine-5-carboxymethylaminomethyl(34) synthesis GTPase MnmE [Rickettsiales bacterium]
METIFAAATVRAKSAVAVIRVSGARATDALTRCSTLPSLPPPRRAAYVAFVHPHARDVIDKGLALYFPAPHSFTGEDCVEWHIHGGPAVVERALRAIGSLEGFRRAEAGEFSRRAYDNRKMNALELEGLADMLSAETDAQAKQAAKLLSGETGAEILRLRDMIVDAQAYIEAYIDFPDEPIPESISDDISLKVATVKAALERALAAGKRNRLVRSGMKVTLFGAPNAGKSTLMNALAKADVAIASPVPGTTRDSISVRLDVGGYPVSLTDTAGLRDSDDAIEKEGVARARNRIADADLALAIVAADEGITDDVRAHIDDATPIIVNKTDKISGPPPVFHPRARHVYASLTEDPERAATEILALIEHFADASFAGGEGAALVTRERHQAYLENALDALSDVDMRALPPEIAAEHLRRAAYETGAVAGFSDTEEMLDKLFREFCIGK